MKKFLTVFFAFTLYFNLISQAHAAVGGWDLKNPVAQGASTVYDATKNVLINGKKFIKESSVKITPTATSVAKVLARGGAGYALSVAVEQLLGAVDWVLDPANNQIKYYIDPNPTAPKPNERYIWKYTGATSKFPDAIVSYGASAAVVCNAVLASHKAAGDPWKYDKVSVSSSSTTHVTCFVSSSKTSYNGNATAFRIDNPSYDPNAQDEREQKTLPLETVAQKVISNAAGGDTAAQAATTAAAADIVSEAENDNTKARPIVLQAEANATTKPADAA